jgi:hypothetical protein
MVKEHVLHFSAAFENLINFFPPGVFMSVAAGCVEHQKYWSAYLREFIGTLLMICFTFSAGKWVGQESLAVAWAFHAIGVIAADYFGGYLCFELYSVILLLANLISRLERSFSPKNMPVAAFPSSESDGSLTLAFHFFVDKLLFYHDVLCCRRWAASESCCDRFHVGLGQSQLHRSLC